MAKATQASREELEKLREENARLKKSIEDLWTINQLARVISSTMPVNRILDRVISVSVRAIGASQGTISLLEEQDTRDRFKTLVRKVDESHFTTKYRLDQDLSGWMIKHRKSLLINDLKNDTTFKGAHSVSEDIRSVLSVPLLCKGKLIGVLNLFNKKSEGGFTSNDQRLLSIIASQSAQVIENARLYEQEKQLRLIEQELTMARSIQERLLPKEAPDIEGFDVAGASFAAKEVGGDYFDFIPLNDGRWTIALGDVSGKGIPAALLMSSVQATLRNQALSAESLVDCMVKSNLFLYNNTESTKFVTLFCGLLEPKRKLFRYVNAGHNYPFYVDTRGSVQKLDVGGLMMGIMPETQYEEASLELHTGDIIVIYSDGVTEAESELEDMYGEERLKNLLIENRRASAQEILELVHKEVEGFSGPEKQDDDITLVVIKTL